MLVFLSEMNCLKKLNDMGIYPDKFYTDFDKFRDEYRFFNQATVCLVFAGSNQFNKTVTLKFADSLISQEQSDLTTNVAKLYIFSDVLIPSLEHYYLYHGNLESVDIMHGWKCLRRNVYPWSKLKSDPKPCQKRLSSYDMCDSDEIKTAYKQQKGSKSEDAYVNLIVVPTLG